MSDYGRCGGGDVDEDHVEKTINDVAYHQRLLKNIIYYIYDYQKRLANLIEAAPERDHED